MPVHYVELEEAKSAKGLRMVVVAGVPSPWGEAAKGIFHIKQLPWLAVRHDAKDPAQQAWTGRPDAPVVFYDDEPPRSGWAEILLLAERIAPSVSLVPGPAEARADMFGLAHELLSEEGLVWNRRLQLVHAGLQDDGGFPKPVAQYLSAKYGYRAADAESYSDRVGRLLDLFAERLHRQAAADSHFYVGNSVTAVDIYSAVAMALLSPLPPEQCAMHPGTRAAFETVTDSTAVDVDPVLIDHRDRLYADYLELPLTL